MLFGQMNYEHALFANLPKERSELWKRVRMFLSQWRNSVSPEDAFADRDLASVESRLGCEFPSVLRELYSFLGSTVWYFSEELGINLFPPADCYNRNLEGHDLLIFAEDYHGAVFGVRKCDLELSDPPVACPGFVPPDYEERLTGFLVRLLFRSTVYSAPIVFQVAESDQIKRQKISAILRSHYTAWQRDDSEVEHHVEGKGIIASTYFYRLTIGVRDEGIYDGLPQDLKEELDSLERKSE